MKIISIDSDIQHQHVKNVSFGDKTSIYGYEIVLLNPNNILSNYRCTELYDGTTGLDLKSAKRLASDLERRKKEIKEYLENKGLLVIYLHKEQIYGARNIKGLYDRKIIHIMPCNISTCIAEGEDIEIDNNKQLLKDWFPENKGKLIYEAIIEESDLEPLLRIKGTDKVVGAYKKYNGCYLLVIPTIKEFKHMSIMDRENIGEMVVGSLKKLYSRLMNLQEEKLLPEWANNYRIKEEIEAEEDNNLITEEIKRLEKEVEVKKDIYKKIKELKVLFTGTDRELVDKVRFVLEQLGLEIHGIDEGRDDIIASYKDQPVVIEVKGVTKSAAEKHAAQLEKWVSEYHIKSNEKPKGMLVVNAYKDKPLNERKEDVFNSQMIPFSKNREHCLISGLQLYCLYVDYVRDLSRQDEIVNKLLKTVGVFDGYENWGDFIY